MWERFRRFSALDRPAQGVFLRAMVLLPLVALSLRLRGLRATQSSLKLLLSDSRPEHDPSLVSKDAALAGRIVNAADQYGLVHPSCLAKSVTLWWLLARQGISSYLRIGIRKVDEKMEAHAWVERDGATLNQSDEHHHHYAAFDAAFSSLPQEVFVVKTKIKKAPGLREGLCELSFAARCWCGARRRAWCAGQAPATPR
jgi:ribosome-associated translation inhibitor RaiA